MTWMSELSGIRSGLRLPSSGGAVTPASAVFSPGGSSGTASLTIPITTTAARGADLGLGIRYDGSTTPGDLGAGWSLDLPRVYRRSDQGVPSYTAADRFGLSGYGDLTPCSGDARLVSADGVSWIVETYRPVLEETLPLVERWLDQATGLTRWRVVTAANVTQWYGRTDLSRVADPDDPSHVAEWLIDEQLDPRGNRIVYDYRAEDGAGIRDQVFEHNRGRFARRYPDRIRYGTHRANPAEEGFAYEVVFDYGEHDLVSLGPGCDPYTPTRAWPERTDPYSSYRMGFELRTYRLCRGVLMFHHLPDSSSPCLVRATTFGYTESAARSLLTTVTETGYRRQPDGSYRAQSRAPITLTYSSPDPDPAPRFATFAVEADAAGSPAPGYLGAGSYQLLDLDGVGTPGLLADFGGVMAYYPPRGPGRFGAPEPLPSFPGHDPAEFAFVDLDGDGGLQLLITEPGQVGYFARRGDGWAPYTPLAGGAVLAAGAEVTDVDGDGRADVLTVHRHEILWYPSRGTRGFGEARRATRPPGFPSHLDGGPNELVTFAPMFGDGGSHRVRVGDGVVEVWPNLGHGRFGPPVVLAGAPRLPASALGVFLCDVDGSGTADLAVAYPDRIELYRNESGNGFAPARTVPLPFTLGALDQVSFVDLRGAGTDALVVTRGSSGEHWWCDLGAPPPEQGAVRPYQLVGIDHGTGLDTRVGYSTASALALADARAGRPWLVTPPHPVPVVTSVAVSDRVTGLRVRRDYHYRDGWFDPGMRRFQGFGFVSVREQTSYPLSETGPVPVPTLTRRWYHTGAYERGDELLARWRTEFNHADASGYVMPASDLDPAILAAGPETARQASRALAGLLLREEVYVDDPADPAAGLPFTVLDCAWTVRLVQPASAGVPGSFFVLARESLYHEYDRVPDDPRAVHTFVLLDGILDGLEQVCERRVLTVAYPRRPVGPGARPGPDRVPDQDVPSSTVERSWVTRVIDGFRMVGAPVATDVLELHGVPGEPGYLTFAQARELTEQALLHEIPYGVEFGEGPQCRPVSRRCVYYWDEDQVGPLPLGEVSARCLPYQEQRAAFSDAWLAATFGTLVSAADLAAAGYVAHEGYWWAGGPVHGYALPDDPAGYHQPVWEASAVGAPFLRATVEYDAAYRLIPTGISSYVDEETALTERGDVDYQAAALWQVTDANGVVRQVGYGPLGEVRIRSLFKPGEPGRPRVGDGDVRDYVERPAASLADILARPDWYLQQVGEFCWYEFGARSDGRPPASVVVSRPRYVSDATAAPVEVSISYATGTGDVDLAMIQVDDLPAGESGRWLAAGRVLTDAAGRPVRSWRPVYADGAGWAPPSSPGSTISYDVLGREVSTRAENGSVRRTVIRPWSRQAFDENDTDVESPFFGTAQVSLLDPAGSVVRTVEDALGDITVDTLARVVGDVAPALWQALVDAGYLVTLTEPVRRTTVTDAFRPYEPDFRLQLPPPYEQYADTCLTLLRKARLTSLAGFDSRQRLVRAADPRLHYRQVHGGGAEDNLRYRYPMESSTAAAVESTDSGPRWSLVDIYGRPVIEVDGRGQRTVREYDGLGRPVRTTVSAPDGPARIAERYEYGEHVPDAAANNMKGRAYRIHDQSGILAFERYTIAGDVAASTRQFTVDAKVEPDWSTDVPLDERTYPTTVEYDARRRPLRQSTPDGTILGFGYDRAGRLASLSATRPGEQPTDLVTAMDYDAGGGRTLLQLGNGARQQASFDPVTSRMTAVWSTGPGGVERQRVSYTYDPVGNVTSVHDDTPTLVFANPQPAIQAQYRYDATYRLLQATGLQGPGLSEDTYATGFKQTVFLPLDAPSPALQQYGETFEYDDSGNLVSILHTSPSGDYSRSSPVAPDSNRLAGVLHDGNGNPLALPLPEPVVLRWDSRDQLAGVSAAPRPDGARQASWFGYDVGRVRTRRVVEYRDATGTLLRTVETRYLGAYVEELTTVDGAVTVAATVRVGDGNRTLAVLEPGGGPVRYQLGDRAWSSTVELSESGAVESYEAYLPYGGSSLVAGPDEPTVAPKVLRYTGKETDDSTGLTYYGGRYHVPWLGRWLNPDPAGAVDGPNSYQFVAGNPTSLIDPDGYQGDEPDFLMLLATLHELHMASARSSSEGPTPRQPILVGRAAPYQSVVDQFINHALHTMPGSWSSIYRDAPIAVAKLITGGERARSQLAATIAEKWMYNYSFLKVVTGPTLQFAPSPLRFAIRPPIDRAGVQEQIRQQVQDPHWLAGFLGRQFGASSAAFPIVAFMALGGVKDPRAYGSVAVATYFLQGLGESVAINAAVEQYMKELTAQPFDDRLAALTQLQRSPMPRTEIYQARQRPELAKKQFKDWLEVLFVLGAGVLLSRSGKSVGQFLRQLWRSSAGSRGATSSSVSTRGSTVDARELWQAFEAAYGKAMWEYWLRTLPRVSASVRRNRYPPDFLSILRDQQEFYRRIMPASTKALSTTTASPTSMALRVFSSSADTKALVPVSRYEKALVPVSQYEKALVPYRAAPGWQVGKVTYSQYQNMGRILSNFLSSPKFAEYLKTRLKPKEK